MICKCMYFELSISIYRKRRIPDSKPYDSFLKSLAERFGINLDTILDAGISHDAVFTSDL